MYDKDDIMKIERLDLDRLEPGKICRRWLRIVENGLGESISVPVFIARGMKEGPTLGVTAAVHGNELNGIPVIQRLFAQLDTSHLCGTIIGVLVVNVPSFERKKRRFLDGTDLNHIMPGKEDGRVSQVYAWNIVDKLIKHFDYLMDLHTASNGRVNSYYIRADMDDPTVKKMALLQNAQIIVHNPPSDGTLRGAADEMGIPAITLEVGNPNLFQKGMIRDGLTGINNFLGEFGFLDCEVEEIDQSTILCSHSAWMYTDGGGLLTVHPSVTDLVKKDEHIATLRNIWGEITKQYHAPYDGVVIGKSVSPVNQTGGRILHLGKLKHS